MINIFFRKMELENWGIVVKRVVSGRVEILCGIWGWGNYLELFVEDVVL